MHIDSNYSLQYCIFKKLEVWTWKILPKMLFLTASVQAVWYHGNKKHENI